MIASIDTSITRGATELQLHVTGSVYLGADPIDPDDAAEADWLTAVCTGYEPACAAVPGQVIELSAEEEILVSEELIQAAYDKAEQQRLQYIENKSKP
jgi:hypothetical protein